MMAIEQASSPALDSCADSCRHDDRIEAAAHAVATAGDIPAVTEFYKLLGSTTRLKILFALQRGELCVCDIAEAVGLSIPATSQQLKSLRHGGLLTRRIDGRTTYFSLTDAALPDIIRDLADRR